MDFVPKNRILQLRPDSFEEIRKEYNLDKPGRMKEAVQLLHEWVQKQPHLKKKDFAVISSLSHTFVMCDPEGFDITKGFNNNFNSTTAIFFIEIQDPFYLEATIIGSKGSLELAKTQLDNMCTMRTLMPKYFINNNIKTDFVHLHKIMHTAILPKLTPDHYRVNITKYNNVPYEALQIHEYFVNHVILAEYLKTHDYLKGFILISDFSQANMMDLVTRVNPLLLREVFKIFIEGYGMRIKSINIISPSKFVDALVSILKQVLSKKLGERVHVYKKMEEIQKLLPKEILPLEYGGEERSIKELSEEWVDILSSKEHMDHLANMNNACTDESCRPKDIFSDQYAGMPGSFRLLSVD